MTVRNLLVILGDQLDPASPLLKDGDPTRDLILMAEVREESTHVWSHKARIAVFLSAMRHFCQQRRDEGWQVEYHHIEDANGPATLADALRFAIAKHKPELVRVVEPGDYRVAKALRQVAPHLDFVPDIHFLCPVKDFRDYAKERKQLRMEYFYRDMRRKYSVLMTSDGKPEGGDWNYDSDNRGSFGKQGPKAVPAPRAFKPSKITRSVLDTVDRVFPQHPGTCRNFDWPVTPQQAAEVLDDFLDHRLEHFGTYQDAMWTGEPYLYHSRISVALNLKLIHPLTVVQAAEERYRKGLAPLAAVEGFIRQILGWREYVRGVYWTFMPQGYASRNALAASNPLPKFYWTGETDMQCLRQAIGQTLEYGYAHHIQRLMVTGLFALLFGVEPKQVHEWYLAVYVDAVEWVELPNTIGMSQFADGGIMASKPYAASGKYIQRMSNYCTGCKYDPAQSTGPNACPFTTLYWDFLLRHEPALQANQRMKMQVRNLDRLSPDQKANIIRQADILRASLS
ncbi:cryptochrome/photolyase family protein [Bryobacterales bacterium F-183]|nr:cryptochrome/photolyase family protein [Bryobacterales bacterium F-183]